MNPPSSASCPSTSGTSRLPRLTPRHDSSSTPMTSKSLPQFKQPKLPTVQALSLAIKKRYSSNRKVPGSRASPSTLRPAAPKRPVVSGYVLGKRAAPPTATEPAKKPRVLSERNRIVADKRPTLGTTVDRNKAAASKKTVNQSRVNATRSQTNADVANGQNSGDQAPQKRKVQPWDLKGKLELSQETVRKLKDELEQSRNRVRELENLGGSAEGQISNLTSRLTEEQSLSLNRLKQIERLQEEERKLQDRLGCQQISLQQLNQKVEELETLLADTRKRCEDQASEIDKLHDTRKLLHNQVQDLKGNIRVLCRVRPPTSKEVASGSPLCHMEYNDQSSVELYKIKEELNSKKKTSSSFSFDRVFPANSTQEDIYTELEQLVQSCLDGYNVCVFAYGQTGSGKTFTMDGLENPDSQRGMIPRTVDTIFNKIDKLKQLGWEYNVKVFFVEIYNEQIHDLLNYNSGLNHEVRMVPNNKTEVFVTNLRVEPVQSQEELTNLMAVARNNRFVASTVCNTHSSRSHFIMKLAVSGTNAKRQLSCSGSISLVDLAGSERYVDNNSAERRKETMNINKSLSSLTSVILALKQKTEHVPYRVSKLTHLLMPSLGGSSKTLMIVNISPLKDCYSESVNSLRFANCVNQCHIVAKKNEKTTATV